MGFVAQAAAVFRRDLSAEWRRKDILITIVIFGLLTVVTFVFAFDPRRHERHDIVPGALWTAYLFAGMLGLNRSAARDGTDGMNLALLISPADRGALYVGRVLSHGLFMLAGQAVILLFTIVFFDLDGRHLKPAFFLILLLGTLGFVSVGTIFAEIGQKTRLREVMLPILLLPVLAPMVMAAVEGTALVMSPGSSKGLISWLQLLIAFDLVFAIVGFLLYGYVLEE